MERQQVVKRVAEIEALIARAQEAELDGLGWLAQFDLETVAREFNGIGPEWAGAKARGVATYLLALFEPAALVHDLRNYVSDGTEASFHYANQEFLLNCFKLADHAYPWYSWRRYRARFVAQALYDFVESPGGWRAWRDCYERNLNHKTSDAGHQTSKSGV